MPAPLRRSSLVLSLWTTASFSRSPAAILEKRSDPVNPRDGASAGKIVLITGAGGCIGSALARNVVRSGAKLVLLVDHSEQNLYEIDSELSVGGSSSHVPILGDISDEALLDEILEKHRPDTIFHAAAFKHVPLMEVNPLAVIRNNVLGTWSLAKTALRHGVRQLIMISTDKAVNPRSVMGAAKRVAELVLLRLSTQATRMSGLRLGNVLGSNGSVVPLFQEQIARGGPVTVTHPEARRYFVSLPETVDLILAVAAINEDAGILIPELGAPVGIVELANRLIREAGWRPGEIEIVYTGLRPGDKLSEDLISAVEWLEPTSDDRLRKINGPGPSPKQLDSAIEVISEGARGRNVTLLIETFCELVPEYQPSETVLALVNGKAIGRGAAPAYPEVPRVRP
jgi:FlaA1/EpsC-like NDP-sugar epimerase